MTIAILIPAYNEELTIENTMVDFFKHSPQSQIIVINNNSSDNTYQIAADTLQKHGMKGRILNEWRKGKGFAVRNALHTIDADIYVMVDADETYAAKDLEKLLKPVLNNEADLVIGDRLSAGQYKKENKRPMHNFGNHLVRSVINILFKTKLRDIMTGYRVMSRTFVKNFPLMSQGFELETEMTLHALDKRFRIVELDIDYKDRPEGSFSKLNTFSDGYKVLFKIFDILRMYRPLVFFSSLALGISVAGLLFGSPVLVEFYNTGVVSHVPLAILAASIEIIAIVLFCIGLVLDHISRSDKLQYELWLYQKV